MSTPRVIIIDSRHPAALGGRLAGLSREGLKGRLMSHRQELRAKRGVDVGRGFIERGEKVPIEFRNGYILGTYRLASFNYKPGLYFGEVDVIRSAEWAATTPVDHWETSAKGPLRRLQVKGSHLGLVRDREGVAGVATWLRRIFSEVERLH